MSDIQYTRRSVYRNLAKCVSIPKRLMLTSGILTLFITAVSLISPYLYKSLVDDVMTAGNIGLLYTLIPVMLVTYLIKAVLSGWSTYTSHKFANLTNLEIKKQMMKKFLHRHITYVSNGDVGKQSSNLEKDSGAVYTFLSSHIVEYLTSFMIAAVYMILMLIIHPGLGLISIILLPLSIWFSHKIGKKYNEVNKEYFAIKSKTKTHLFDTVQRWREIKSNTLEEQFADEYDRKLEPERKLNTKWMVYFALRELFYLIKNQFVMKVLIYFIGGLLIIAQDISIGALLMFISYMGSMSTALDALMKSNSDFIGQKAVFERIFSILDEPKLATGKACPKDPTITLQNIDFAYVTSARKVFTDACCEFAYGNKYLIVGKSGEGKSTLIKLLLGLHQPQNGKIFLNDVDFSEVDPQSVLQNIGTVMQENMFFNLSIRENLLLIAQNATEKDIWEALKTACLDDFVHSLPEKLDTIIGERGIKLSGGQKQRLAIARLVLHNPQIIILDEATSALDSIVESEILDNLKGCFKDRTLIIISHKPLVNYDNDYTYIVDNQIIVEKTNNVE